MAAPCCRLDLPGPDEGFVGLSYCSFGICWLGMNAFLNRQGRQAAKKSFAPGADLQEDQGADKKKIKALFTQLFEDTSSDGSLWVTTNDTEEFVKVRP
eukprot:1187537-Prorocentrum_minimum.AAC.3